MMKTVQAKVLVVEDEWITARDLQETLTHLGYDVPEPAGSGEEALAQAEQLRPDLVLMDIRLKGAMDGVEAARELRRRYGTPVVFLTAHSDEATLGRAKEVEPHGFLVKPFSEAELRSTIETALYKAEAERVRQQSERRFRALTEHSTDLISIVDAEGVIRYENAAVERVLGYGKEERIGMSVFELIHPEDRPSVLKRMQRLLTDPQKEHQRVGVRARHKHGSWRWMEAIGANHLDDPAVQGIVVNSRDITERKRMEEALRKSNERHRLTIESARDYAIITTDPDGRIDSWSPGAEAVFGWSVEEVLGQSGAVTFTPEDRASGAPERELSIARKEGTVPDVRWHVRKDGSRVYIRGTTRALRNGEGRLLGFLKIGQDVTERYRMEETLRRAKEAAEEASRAKSEMLSRTSHELRTPLNAILGFGQLLELEVEREEDRESVGQILRAGRHLLGLIDEVLDLARAESGQMRLPSEPVHVGETVEEVLSLVRPLARQHRIELPQSPCERCDVHVHADPQRFKQVLLDLLSNAIQYNREAGRVDITCAEVEGGRVRIRVRDTGPGIPPDKLKRLFTPFERAGAEQSGIKGAGLGLALAKAFTEAMAGTIGAESTRSEGSTFWVELPCAREQTTTPAERPSEEGEVNATVPEAAGPRAPVVLYVEDTPANVRLVERILNRSRPEVELITAPDGERGLELAKEHQPDLILLDLNLPDISGEEILAALQKNASTRGIPVVMLSGDANSEQMETVRDLGAVEYLTKPFGVPHFLEVVDGVLDRDGRM